MLTATGKVRLRRVSFVCRRCRVGAFPADERLGVDGPRSRQAERLLCLAGASWSFDRAAAHLREFCGLAVSDDTVRRVCQDHGTALGSWRQTAPEAVAVFRRAEGDVEFQTDGTSVNTTGGWREMKLGIFSRRHRGAPAQAADWDTRRLPPPHARLAFAAIERSDRFGTRWKAWARRLGLLDPSRVTVLADGARWIWEEQIKNLRGAAGVLDIYHALEHAAATGKRLHGEGTTAAAQWTAAARTALLTAGKPGLDRLIQTTAAQTADEAGRKAVASLADYLRPHVDHLNYPERLAAGLPIGSGQVEGGCKQIIGRRLKQTGARWRIRCVNRMAILCCAFYSDHWTTYWNPAPV